jgi:hypothetical protein
MGGVITPHIAKIVRKGAGRREVAPSGVEA